MKKFDVLVIGSGEGKGIAFSSAAAGLKTAIIEKGIYKGYIGGTCLAVGCVPTKTIITPADHIMEAERAQRLGVHFQIKEIDFTGIMERMRAHRKKTMDFITDALKTTENLELIQGEAHFTGEYTLEVNGEELSAEKIFIATGARPFVPPIKGLQDIGYLTNESALELTEKPESLIILGGGYVSMEFAHFFSAMGTKVTVIEISDRLVGHEEPEISGLLKKEMDKRMEILTGAKTLEFKKTGNKITALVQDVRSGNIREITAEKVFAATGRKSNADLLQAEKAGIELDSKGFIKVNDYLETNKKNIWAIGDATGQQMFTEAADKEAHIAWHNAARPDKKKMAFWAVPHAVFTWPQIAGVGLTEEIARKSHKVLTGIAKYSDTAKGQAMMEENGFAKAIIEEGSRKILGFSIIGPEAPVLLQEVTNAFAQGGTADDILDKMHIFPALSELIPETFSRIK